MSGPRRGGRHRKDGNHDLVVTALARLGLGFLDASQSDLGLDGFVVGRGRIVPVEIKDPGGRYKLALSPREARVHAFLWRHGVRVEVLTGDDSSLDVFREPFRNSYDRR